MKRILTAAVVLALGLAQFADAETLKIAVGQRGNWDTAIPELGQRAGIFKKYGLDLDILYTSGGGETQQAVMSRSVDIGTAAGSLGALGAASKGAPIRIISSEMTGAPELYWYVPANSPIKSVADLAGKTVGYSTTGSSTNTVIMMARAQYKVDFNPTATGGLPATFTQAMSGQIDVGWASAPFGVDALNDGKIRVIIRGRNIDAARGQTVRVNLVHAAVLAAKRPAIERFMQAYRETLDWMYSSPDAIPTFVAFSGVSTEIATKVRDEYFPKSTLAPDQMVGLDSLMSDGVTFKFMAAPLSEQQVKDVVQLLPASK
jgi:NitT/TauT family transport system substrate-binding protein